MLSSIPCHDDDEQQQQADELLRGALTNVGLFADTIWSLEDDDDEDKEADRYRELNRRLWIRTSKTEETYARIAAQKARETSSASTKRRVSDVIPESRLATYGEYEYEDELVSSSSSSSNVDVEVGNHNNNNSERIASDDREVVAHQRNGNFNDHNQEEEESVDECKEPWLLDEVEDYVAWLSDWAKRRRSTRRANSRAAARQEESAKSSKPASAPDPTRSDSPTSPTPPPRYSVTNVSVAQLEGRIFNDSVRNIWQQQQEEHSATVASIIATTHQQQCHPEQIARGLRQCQRELRLLRPSGNTGHYQQQQRASSPAGMKRTSDVQQTHYSFQSERLRMPSRCPYSYVQQAINMVQQQQQSHQRPASLCVDVPEFFPKVTAAASTSSTSASWVNSSENVTSLMKSCAQQQQYYTAQQQENPYQDEIYTYKGYASCRKPVTTTANVAAAAAVAVYQNTLVPMIPTPVMSAIVWPTQVAWTQRMLPSATSQPIHIHHHQMPTATLQPLQSIAMQPAAAPAIGQPPPAAPMCPTVLRRPILIQDSTTGGGKSMHHHHQQHKSSSSTSGIAQIPVYQRPSKPPQEYNQRKRNQGVDFNNLILLTKSSVKIRRNQTGKSAKKQYSVDNTVKAVAGTSGHAKVAVDTTSSARWFEKAFKPKREREYLTVNTSSCHQQPSDTASNPSVRDNLSPEASSSARAASIDEQQQDVTTGADVSVTSRKRLYRDVLENATAEVRDEAGSFEMRYDELERQAMEQYRTSDECLTQRYQELEQQAMEQYRNAESLESIDFEYDRQLSANPLNEGVGDVDTAAASNAQCGREMVDVDAEVAQEYPSGFGKYTTKNDRAADDERGNETKQQRIKILKPESKQKTTKSATLVHRALSEGNLRPIAVAKRVTINGCRRESKNASRGASDEKIAKMFLTTVHPERKMILAS